MFLGRLVEHFALLAEGAALLDELIEVFTALEHRVDRVVQHDLGIIQFLLHTQDRVSLTGVLVPRKVVLRIWEFARADNALTLGRDLAGRRQLPCLCLPD